MERLFKYNKTYTIAGVILFLILGILTFDTSVDERKESILKYIKDNNHKTYILINAKSIRQWEDLFNYGNDSKATYADLWSFSEFNNSYTVDTIGDDRYKITLRPTYNKDNKLTSFYYLNEIDDYGFLADYYLNFYLKGNNVEKVEGVLVGYANKQEKEYIITDISFNLSTFAKVEDIEEQRNYVAELKASEENARAQRVKNEQQIEDFKSKCMNVLNGSCRPLVDLVKKNMHDPKSFEHIETKFWNQSDHVVVKMQYRGNNRLGALVVNSISARVAYDCTIFEIDE